MTHRIAHRSLSVLLAAVFTVIILGGIDQLAQSPEAAAQWAQLDTTPRG